MNQQWHDDFDDDVTVFARPMPASSPPVADDFDDDVTVAIRPAAREPRREPMRTPNAVPEFTPGTPNQKTPFRPPDLTREMPTTQAAWRPPSRVTPESMQPSHEKPKRSRLLIVAVIVAVLAIAGAVAAFLVMSDGSAEEPAAMVGAVSDAA